MHLHNDNEDAKDKINEQEILDYLRKHPDFFQRHVAALSELTLPHESGGAVSLVERQIDILRDRNVAMRRRMNELLARRPNANDEIFAKTRSLNLALLEVSSWHELNEVLATHVLVDFEADFVCTHMLDADLASIVRSYSTSPQGTALPAPAKQHRCRLHRAASKRA